MTSSATVRSIDDFKLSTLAKEAGVALIIQILGITLLYVVQVALAQWMGGVEFGIYQYVISWSALLGLPAGLGFPRAV
ncbi:MAG: flippase, partial [Prochlorothrix sp.]